MSIKMTPKNKEEHFIAVRAHDFCGNSVDKEALYLHCWHEQQNARHHTFDVIISPCLAVHEASIFHIVRHYDLLGPHVLNALYIDTYALDIRFLENHLKVDVKQSSFLANSTYSRIAIRGESSYTARNQQLVNIADENQA